jgi:uncharacterized protein YkwD
VIIEDYDLQGEEILNKTKLFFLTCAFLFLFFGIPMYAQNNANNRRADSDAANWNIASLDTAKNANYLSPLEKDVILEMNKVRANPKKYAELYIQPTLRFFEGNLYKRPGEIILQTKEGKKAVEECIKVLSKAKGVSILTPESGLSRAAKDHTADQGSTGQVGHGGSDGSDPFKRMERYGGGFMTAGENIAYGEKSGRDIVVQLLVDDGVPSRGHRESILNDDFKQTGVSFSSHPGYRTMCVIAYAAGYKSK